MGVTPWAIWRSWSGKGDFDFRLSTFDFRASSVERAAADGDSVVAPWGAAPLGAVEAELEASGWERGGWRTRVVVAWVGE